MPQMLSVDPIDLQYGDVINGRQEATDAPLSDSEGVHVPVFDQITGRHSVLTFAQERGEHKITIQREKP